MKRNSYRDVNAKTFYDCLYKRSDKIAGIPKDDNYMYAQVIKELKPYLCSGKSILDLGCNNGNLSLYIANHACDVIGIDISDKAIDLARRSAKYHEVSNAKFYSLDFVEQWNAKPDFDLVFCSHVIEHVQDEEAFLEKIQVCIKPGGALLVLAPTIYSSMYRTYKLFTGKFAFDEEVGHIRRYSEKGLSHSLTSAGFDIVSVKYLDSPLREWAILCKALKYGNILWGRRYIRKIFNYIDEIMAQVVCPATICIHAVKRP